MNTVKDKLNNTDLKTLINNFDLQQYITPEIGYNMSIDSLIDLSFKFNETNQQKFFMSQLIYEYLYHKSDDLHEVEMLIHIALDIYKFKNKIPFDIYMLLLLKHIEVFNDDMTGIDYVIDNLTKDNLVLFNFALDNRLIFKKYREKALNKIISILFNQQEQTIINQYFSNQYKKLVHWFFNTSFEYHKYINKNLRTSIISHLYLSDYHYIHQPIDNQKLYLQTLLQYFTDELIYSDNFVKVICYHNLLTKDLIDKIFKTPTFYMLEIHHKQFDDYIKSLSILKHLQGD